MTETIKYLILIALFLIIFVFLIIIISMIRLFFVSRRRENNFKTGMITIINERAEDNEAYFESINELYAEYCSSAQKKELTLDVFTLNTKLVHELRNHNYKKYYKEDLPDNGMIANEVEEVIKHLHERLRNDDDVLIEILCKIDELPIDDQAKVPLETLKGEILSYITTIVATSDGRVMEKDIALAQAASKLKKANRWKIITFLVGAIGTISALMTIFNNLIFR